MTANTFPHAFHMLALHYCLNWRAFVAARLADDDRPVWWYTRALQERTIEVWHR